MIAIPLALSVFDVDLVTDLSATISIALVAELIDLEKDTLVGKSPCGDMPCEISLIPSINRFDRWVTANESANALMASDILLWSMSLLPLSGLLEDPADTLVGYQTLATTYLLTSMAKQAVKRPRPLAYNPLFDEQARLGGDARLSFPSGHSSMAFASATAFAIPWLARRDPVLGVAGAATAYALASLTAALRVAGGKHFVTDVVAGAVLGIAVGLVVGFSHGASEPVQDMDGR
jgi:membrane-associated phospholipid phosphatase